MCCARRELESSRWELACVTARMMSDENTEVMFLVPKLSAVSDPPCHCPIRPHSFLVSFPILALSNRFADHPSQKKGTICDVLVCDMYPKLSPPRKHSW